MTARTNLVEVVCDGPGPLVDCPGSLAWADYGTAAQLRARMRDDGWKVAQPGGIDQCPSCRKGRPE